MKIFLAGQSSCIDLDWSKCKYNLESFYYFKASQKEFLKKWDMFFLDSGAFTFMQKCKDNIDWLSYIEKYIDFIIENDIKYFFELDIDCIVGYEKVKEYREMIERKTGKKCIPVWHKSRGLEEYIKLCENYDYIAIGGIANKEIKRNDYPVFKELLRIAHKRKCKVHGLGFTNTKELCKYKFDSVDSTTWNRGRFGDLYYFENGTMRIYKPKNSRLKNGKKANAFCLKEWVKFQHYADKKL